MRTVLSLLLFALPISQESLGASLPKPAKSEFLISTFAGFLLKEGSGAYYGMNYSVRKALPGTVFGVAIFDNPEDLSRPLRTETIIDAQATEIQLESPPIHSFTNHKRYTVHLMLYTDPEHTHLLGTHSQEVLFEVPPQLAAQMATQYGVTVR